MSKYVLVLIYFFLLSFSSCLEEKDSKVYKEIALFSPYTDLTVAEIKDFGFEFTKGCDIPTYDYNNNDTVLILTYDFEKINIIHKRWIIKMNIEKTGQLRVFFENYHAYIRPFKYIEDNIDIENSIYKNIFFVRRHDYNQLYECQYDAINKELHVSYMPLIDLNQ